MPRGMTRQVVLRFIKAIEQGDTKALDEVLAQDFVFAHEKAPKPMDKPTFIRVARAMQEAFPDCSFNPEFKEESPDRVTADIKIRGTHTGTLDVPLEGIPRTEATGRKVELPTENGIWILEGGKITRHEVPAVEGGGFEGILQQIGAAPEAEH